MKPILRRYLNSHFTILEGGHPQHLPISQKGALEPRKVSNNMETAMLRYKNEHCVLQSQRETDSESDDDRFLSHSVPFPWKLHEMLDATEKDGLASVVSWLPDQRSFKVYQNEPFVRDIMPKWFRQSKYKSFQRQCKTTATCCRW